MPEDLTPLRDAIADSTGIGTASEALGIGHHGVEQLIVLDVVDGVDAPRLDIVHKGRRVSRKGLASFLDRLRALPRAEKEDVGSRLTLRRALMHVGGREKPWGPVFRAILDGSLPARHNARRPDAKAVDAITTAAIDRGLIETMTFDRDDHPGVRFTRVMPVRDACSLLNVNPAVLQKALSQELKRCVQDGGLEIGPTLAVARCRIGGAEIATRFMGGSLRLPPFLRIGGLVRQGPLGWDRQAVERAFGVAAGSSGSTPSKREETASKPTTAIAHAQPEAPRS